MKDKTWTAEMIAERLEEAANTLRRLWVAGIKPREYGNSWPTIIHDAMEAYGWDKAVLRLGPPPADAISRMDEAMEWLHWLKEPDRIRLVWLRAEKVSWKVLAKRFGVCRETARLKRMEALVTIASRLNYIDERKCPGIFPLGI